MTTLYDKPAPSRWGWIVGASVVAGGLAAVFLFVMTIRGDEAEAAPTPAPATSASVGVSGAEEDAIANAAFADAPPTDRSIVLPDPARFELLGQGFPATAEGAAAALVAVADATTDGFDPAHAQAVINVAVLPGGDGGSGWADSINDMRSTRASAGLPATGAAPGWSFSWTPLMAKVRGTTQGGRFVQACVLGISRADHASDEEKSGGGPTGTCQRMWRIGDEWRIEDKYSIQPDIPEPLTDEAFAQGWRTIK